MGPHALLLYKKYTKQAKNNGIINNSMKGLMPYDWINIILNVLIRGTHYPLGRI